ncbi:MAG: phosphoribosyltransferase [Thaumarchaeota archaeon]|nr:MAG: phosphoribosyltransferase [Nitrososphaerota archaeon]
MLSDRIDAGIRLSEKMIHLKAEDCLVLAIPRGGVVVGNQIAKSLGCKLDVIISKKINPPGNREYAIGAIMPDGTILWNHDVSAYLESSYLKQEIEGKKVAVEAQLKKFRGRSDYDLAGKAVILVDDGIATGATALVILKWLAKLKPKKIFVATPVVAADVYEEIKKNCDTVVALLIPTFLHAVSQFYEKFNEVEDKEVLNILSNYMK